MAYVSQSTTKRRPMSVVGTLTAFNTMNMRASAALGTLALAILTAVAEILWNP